MGKLHVHPFLEEQSSTISYIVHEEGDKRAAIIDSVLNFDHKSGRTSTESADELIAFMKEHDLTLEWILETHAHADHLSAAPYLKAALGGKIAIGEHIKTVQEVFSKVFNAKDLIEKKYDASQFDALFKDGQTFKIGDMEAEFRHTPGHTPACGVYVVRGEACFIGDTLFMPDAGTARCDFPGGSAEALYTSIHEKIFTLPDETKLYMCHDYGPNGREIAWETTVKQEKEENIHVGLGKTMADFVKMRTARDATLEMPLLILPSVQVNMRAGQMPELEDNGVVYLKIPVNAL